jgi:hypothetical protein
MSSQQTDVSGQQTDTSNQVKQSYRISNGNTYDLSLNDGSNTEDGQGVLRFDPLLWMERITRTRFYVFDSFFPTIM